MTTFSLCDDRYVKSALFFKTLEGFIEAGPQFAFQLSLLLKGRWGESSKSVLFLPTTTTTIAATTLLEGDELATTTLIPFEFEEENTTIVMAPEYLPYTTGMFSTKPHPPVQLSVQSPPFTAFLAPKDLTGNRAHNGTLHPGYL